MVLEPHYEIETLLWNTNVSLKETRILIELYLFTYLGIFHSCSVCFKALPMAYVFVLVEQHTVSVYTKRVSEYCIMWRRHLGVINYFMLTTVYFFVKPRIFWEKKIIRKAWQWFKKFAIGIIKNLHSGRPVTCLRFVHQASWAV